MWSWRQIVEAYQVDILALAVLRYFEQVQNAQKARDAREFWSDIGESDGFDGVDFDVAVVHGVLGTYCNAGAQPDAYAAGDFSAADTVAKALGEDHGESLIPRSHWESQTRNSGFEG
jgi:hypothetical protein